MKAGGIVLLNGEAKGAPAALDAPFRFGRLLELALCVVYLEAHYPLAYNVIPALAS
jgi:hypothetical protein